VTGAGRTQVAIIGGGPAGLFLAHLLHRAGIFAAVLESRSRSYVEQRVRAGVLEHATVAMMEGLGIGVRVKREGLVHSGLCITDGAAPFRIDLAQRTGGKTVTVYGQQEAVKDLYDAAQARGIRIVFEAADVRLHDCDSSKPVVTYAVDGEARRLECDFIAGCDGFHGVSRASIPPSLLAPVERVYPFAWLGILADVPPVSGELIYASHDNGFALASMRSAKRSRCYVQCDVDDNVANWPDARFWDEFCVRIGRDSPRGMSIEKSIAPVRSFCARAMRHGRLFLAGDAAHIVPPIGAKGLNLAASDALILSEAFATLYRNGDEESLESYSARALARVRNADAFSRSFLELTHWFPDGGPSRGEQRTALEHLRVSEDAQTAFAQNYVGLPL